MAASVTRREGPGRIFVDGTAYTDLDHWHETAARLRAADPVHRVEAPGFVPFWAVTRHADVIEIERRHQQFLNTRDSVLLPISNIEGTRARGVDIKTLVHMDGAEHQASRAIVNEWFKPANLRRLLQARVASLARQFVDRMLAFDGECDFARDVALLFPLQVIMSILGVPESDEPRMLQLTQQLFGNEDPEFGGEDREQAMLAALVDFGAYFGQITADRRASPTDDIASVIANATIDGRPLGDLETASYYVLIATAGHDTTSSALTGGFEALLRDRDQLAALVEQPELIDNAVDEIIRWTTPVRHFMRQATEAYVLRDTALAPGDWLLLSYLSANRDEAVFDDPLRFDVRRSNASDHVAFGIGVHFCLGAHLARMELRAFLRELLPRLERIELAGAPEHVAGTFVGGLKRLPIRYRLRPGS